MSGGSSQKFIARNRAPRVQIEYDVELYGAEKKVQLPFVMGVMSDLSGKSEVEQPAVADRKFLEIDVDNFDDRMKAIAPRAAFTVPNTLTGEGNMAVDITFESMDDFSPGAIAAKIAPLRELLDARTQLSNLMTYMDGKTGAEELIERILTDPALLSSLSTSAVEASAEMDRVLGGIEAVEDTAEDDTTGDVLAGLAANAPEDAPEDTSMDDILGSIEAVEDAPEDTSIDDALGSIEAIEDTPEEDNTDDILGSIEAVEDAPEDTSIDDALGSIEAIEETPEEDTTDDILGSIEAVEDAPEDTSIDDALGSIEAIEDTPEEDNTDDILGSIEAVEDAPEDTSIDDALGSIEAIEETPEEDNTDDILGSIEAVEDAPEEKDDLDDILGGLDPVEETSDDAGFEDILGSIEAIEETPEEDTTDDILGSIEAVEDAPEDTSIDDALGSIEAIEETPEEDTTDDILGSIEAVEDAPEEKDDLDDILGGLDPVEETSDDAGFEDILGSIEAIGETPEEDTTDDILGSIEAVEDAPEDTSIDDALGSIEAIEDTPEEDNTDDILGSIEAVEDAPEEKDDLDDILGGLDPVEETSDDAGFEDILGSIETVEDAPEKDDIDDILGDLGAVEVDDGSDGSGEGLGDLLGGLTWAPTSENNVGFDDILGDLDAAEVGDSGASDGLGDALAELTTPPTSGGGDGLDDILGDLGATDLGEDTGDRLADLTTPPTGDGDGLDDLLGDLGATNLGEDTGLDGLTTPPTGGDDGLDDLLGDLGAADLGADAGDGLGDLLGDLTSEASSGGDDGLDDLLGDLGATDLGEETGGDLDALFDGLDLGGDDAAEDTDDLDDLLAGLDGEDTPDELDDLLADLDNDDADGDDAGLDDLDALMASLGEDAGGDAPDTAPPDSAASGDDTAPDAPKETTMSEEPEFAFGTISADRPDAQRLNRRRFRIALLGDFSGRAARGLLETGDALAERPAILLDPDTVEDVIEGFATTLVLPLGKDGTGISVKLKEFDDLHPDELYEKVEIFSELQGLKQQLASGGTAAKAAERLKAWAAEYGQGTISIPKIAAGATVRADLKLSDFQKLIGDTKPRAPEPGPLDEMIARIVAPHIRALPDPSVTAMQKAVDEALSGAMRMLLHHPDFQTVEAQWRSLDLIARSVEASDQLEVMLYDISAEEIAADLAAAEDLSASGLVRMLTEKPLDEETGRGGYSAVMGLYTFEETPPHAHLLGRMARVGAHIDAPVFAAITPAYLDVPVKERHPLVAQAWDDLRAMPEAGHLGLVSPRFLLRRPYGAKTEPIYEFDFEEFTMSEGMRGMLWANPVVLVTILLAKHFQKNGAHMGLGQIMSLGDMPYHYVTDRYGDQVALPCTERNMSVDKHTQSVQRGYMPVLSIKGRDEIRLGSFNSVAGKEILGPWSGVAPPPPSPPKPAAKPAAKPEVSAEEDDLLGDLGLDDLDTGAGDDDLDALLSGFGLDDDDGGDGDGDIDADLAALLEDL